MTIVLSEIKIYIYINTYPMKHRIPDASQRERDVKYGHQYLELLDLSTRIFYKNRQSFWFRHSKVWLYFIQRQYQTITHIWFNAHLTSKKIHLFSPEIRQFLSVMAAWYFVLTTQYKYYFCCSVHRNMSQTTHWTVLNPNTIILQKW
jgi:hypothetical protein